MWLNWLVGSVLLEQLAYQYVSSRPTSSSDPEGLWRRDVHEEDTTFLARAVRVRVGGQQRCFSAKTRRIGRSDYGVDTNPLVGPPGSSWHFDVDLLHPRTAPAWTGSMRAWPRRAP